MSEEMTEEELANQHAAMMFERAIAVVHKAGRVQRELGYMPGPMVIHHPDERLEFIPPPWQTRLMVYYSLRLYGEGVCRALWSTA